MEIHEYQAKELLSEFGVRTASGGTAHSPDEAVYQAREIGGRRWVVKAQVHSGARGKAGGIKICQGDHEVRDATEALLGKRLFTQQSGPRGKPVNSVYIEPATEIERELYLGLILDRSIEQIVIIASAHGGMEIEEVAETYPDSVLRLAVEPAMGLLDFQAREIACGLDLPPTLIGPAVSTLRGAYRAFRDLDATLLEINPLVVTKDGRLLAVDAKLVLDDNALFRQQRLAELRDRTQQDPIEVQAFDQGLSYVGLEGNIGCMINGAGLAMATMDMIKHAGGEPANFLDIGGGASPERVATAFNLVLSDANVEAILVNIYAGINRCDWVAKGVVEALQNLELHVPLVVRLSGTHVEEGKAILKGSGLPIITADNLAEAATRVVDAASSQ